MAEASSSSPFEGLAGCSSGLIATHKECQWLGGRRRRDATEGEQEALQGIIVLLCPKGFKKSSNLRATLKKRNKIHDIVLCSCMFELISNWLLLFGGLSPFNSLGSVSRKTTLARAPHNV